MITDKNYDTMYDERDYRAEWEKEYKDEDDYEADEADWRLDDEREMHRD